MYDRNLPGLNEGRVGAIRLRLLLQARAVTFLNLVSYNGTSVYGYSETYNTSCYAFRGLMVERSLKFECGCAWYSRAQCTE